jgi:hypothetical protein
MLVSTYCSLSHFGSLLYLQFIFMFQAEQYFEYWQIGKPFKLTFKSPLNIAPTGVLLPPGIPMPQTILFQGREMHKSHWLRIKINWEERILHQDLGTLLAMHHFLSHLFR